MSEKPLTPLEAIERTIRCHFSIGGGSYSNHHGGDPTRRKTLMPGALIERMPESVRQGLRQLKSYHFDFLPMDSWRFEDAAYTRKKGISDMLVEFDQKILK